MFDRAVKLSGGRVGFSRRALPMRVPCGAVLSPGPIAAGTLDMLPAAAEIVERVAPWASVQLAPAVWNVDEDGDSSYAALYSTARRTGRDGTRYYRVNGLAWTSDGQAHSCVSLQPPHRLLPIIHHELFHNVSKRLTAEAHAVLDAAVAGTPIEYPGEYAGRAEERKARFYEHFASALDEGMRIPLMPGSAEEILYGIYRGDWA